MINISVVTKKASFIGALKSGTFRKEGSQFSRNSKIKLHCIEQLRSHRSKNKIFSYIFGHLINTFRHKICTSRTP